MNEHVDWLKLSGTGEQAQREALKLNLKNIKSATKDAIDEYSVGSLKNSPEIKNLTEKANEFLKAIDALSTTQNPEKN